MARPSRVPLALVVLLLTAGPAASWSMREDRLPEPSTPSDHTSIMWPDPSRDGARIYFNGFLVPLSAPYVVGGPPRFVPDRMAPLQSFTFGAVLGFWNDCNRDGFIGDALLGLDVYPATFPSASCAAPFSDGVWVRELLPIGWPSRDPSAGDRHLVSDPDVRVYADWMEPAYVDDRARFYAHVPPREALRDGNTALEEARARFLPSRTRGEVDGLGGAGTFESIWRPATHPAAGIPLWAPASIAYDRVARTDGGRGEPIHLLWDCDTTEPLPRPNERPPNPDGTIVATLEAEQVPEPGARRCTTASGQAQDLGVHTYPLGSLEGWGIWALPPTPQRVFADDVFHFVPHSPPPTLRSLEDEPPPLPVHNRWQSAGLGVSSWNSDRVWYAKPSELPGSSGAVHKVFYATLSERTLNHARSAGLDASWERSLPGGWTGHRYGSDFCTADGQEIDGSWACDAAFWHDAASFHSHRCLATPPYLRDAGPLSRCPVVNQPYHLRDVDCWDHSASGLRAKTTDPKAVVDSAPSSEDPEALIVHAIEAYDPTIAHAPANPSCGPPPS